MNDDRIIELFFSRDEQAISEARNRYGSFCRHIAFNLLRNREDADECVNDAMLVARDSIPPNKPISLRAFLGGITRHTAFTRCLFANISQQNCLAGRTPRIVHYN